MFHYLSDYSVLICKEHGYAGHNIQTHLNREHHLDRQEKKHIQDLYQGLNLISPEEVINPLIKGAPIECLRIYHGLQCLICDHIAVSENTMRSHCNKSHKWFSTWQQSNVDSRW